MGESRGSAADGESQAVPLTFSDLKAEILRKAIFVPSNDLVEVLGGDAEDGGDVEVEIDDLPTEKAGMRGKSVFVHSSTRARRFGRAKCLYTTEAE